MLARVFLGCVCLLVIGCSNGPPPRQYLLEPVLDPINKSVPPVIDAVALAEVVVPAYASDQRVASRDKRYQINYDEKNKWADSPDEALTRVLANRLRYYLQATVIVEPWPRGYDPQARIEVQFDKLLREATGGAEMSGQIRIISGDGKQMIDVLTFQFVRYANNRQHGSFYAAVAAGVNDISRMAADSLRKHTGFAN